jgi:hypothetical protein
MPARSSLLVLLVLSVLALAFAATFMSAAADAGTWIGQGPYHGTGSTADAPSSAAVGAQPSRAVAVAFDAHTLHGATATIPSRPITVTSPTYLPALFRLWPLPIPGAVVLNPVTPKGWNSYELAWSTANLATSYLLQYDANSNFANPTTAYGGPATVSQANGIFPGTYCYRVQGVNMYGSGPWSNASCVAVVQHQDDFVNPAGGWHPGDDPYASVRYVNGEYQILVKQADYFVWDELDFGASDFSAEVDVRAASHLNGANGLIFSGTDGGAYLYVVSDGWFTLVRLDAATNSLAKLIDWSSTGVIRPGSQVNRLRVVKEGASITLYANGQQVGQAYDGTYISGTAGMVAWAGSDNYDGRFDNFSITYVSSVAGQAGSQALPGGAGAESGKDMMPFKYTLPNRLLR